MSAKTVLLEIVQALAWPYFILKGIKQNYSNEKNLNSLGAALLAVLYLLFVLITMILFITYAAALVGGSKLQASDVLELTAFWIAVSFTITLANHALRFTGLLSK